eukprot:TRINITY_DN982_c0_g4_i1.p1 TRINITY_DN982_c0_g4~~TRINITY_DN982_c0_g4_i1.p1  ORF type:complete len:208 (+),score=22.26 TRINITY_DN982_c0_g4_i1:109-732(+)
MSAETSARNHHATFTGRWTKEEHQKFVEAVRLYGKNWKKVEEHVGTRTGAQIRSHAQKFFNRLQREVLPENPCPLTLPTKFSTTCSSDTMSVRTSHPEYFSEEERELTSATLTTSQPDRLQQEIKTQKPEEGYTNSERLGFIGSFYEVIMEKFKLYRKDSYYNLKLSDLVDLRPRSSSDHFQSPVGASSFRSVRVEEPPLVKQVRLY